MLGGWLHHDAGNTVKAVTENESCIAGLAPQRRKSQSSLLQQRSSISSKLQMVENGRRNKHMRRGQRGALRRLLNVLFLEVASTEAGAHVCHLPEIISFG
jgi:hypothetical protein